MSVYSAELETSTRVFADAITAERREHNLLLWYDANTARARLLIAMAKHAIEVGEPDLAYPLLQAAWLATSSDIGGSHSEIDPESGLAFCGSVARELEEKIHALALWTTDQINNTEGYADSVMYTTREKWNAFEGYVWAHIRDTPVGAA